MLRLAGCSSGTGVCARGGCSAGRGGALAAFRGRCAFRGSVRNAGPVLPHGEAVARRHFALRSSVYRRLGGVARSYRNVVRSSQACRTFPSECRAFISSLSRVPIAAFCVRSRLLFAALRQTGRLAVSCVPVPPGRDRHLCVLVMSARLSAFAGSLRVWPFLCGDPDGVARGRGGRRTENGAGGAV